MIGILVGFLEGGIVVVLELGVVLGGCVGVMFFFVFCMKEVIVCFFFW